MWCWIKSSFVDLDGWENGWFWFGWSEFLRGDYLLDFWWKIRHFMGFINYVGLMQESF
ncbi:hypothetical protein [uncultured Gammaproteobacteria bacterium]|nr:hypothetical protein [uncultured Gammaproteobacteria bacterium]CAC9978061.1 hypothetical protein [uncultured Gammaproteobacteria bacterium]